MVLPREAQRAHLLRIPEKAFDVVRPQHAGELRQEVVPYRIHGPLANLMRDGRKRGAGIDVLVVPVRMRKYAAADRAYAVDLVRKVDVVGIRDGTGRGDEIQPARVFLPQALHPPRRRLPLRFAELVADAKGKKAGMVAVCGHDGVQFGLHETIHGKSMPDRLDLLVALCHPAVRPHVRLRHQIHAKIVRSGKRGLRRRPRMKPDRVYAVLVAENGKYARPLALGHGGRTREGEIAVVHVAAKERRHAVHEKGPAVSRVRPEAERDFGGKSAARHSQGVGCRRKFAPVLRLSPEFDPDPPPRFTPA